MTHRILFLSQALPYPPESGGTQRTFNVLKELQKGFDVSLVAFSRKKHQADGRARKDAERSLAAILSDVRPAVPLPAEQSSARRAWDHARSLVVRRAYSFFQYGDSSFGERIEDALSTAEPDLVHLDSIDLFRWADRFQGIPVTCTHHDIESHLLRRRAATAGNPLMTAYIQHQASLVEKVEAAYCPRFDLNLTMSPVDSARLLEVAPDSRVYEAPNAVNLADFELPDPEDEVADSVVFVGPTYLFANADAVRFLLDDIWPRVRKRNSRATLKLVGRNAPGEPESFRSIPGVAPMGRVDDVRPQIGSAACSVIPIRVGGGTRIKILESWAMGRAVVTTSLGGEGLDVVDGENALVRDDPEDFAEAVTEVLAQADLRRRLGRGGRATVAQKYDWSKVGAGIRQRYQTIIRSGASR